MFIRAVKNNKGNDDSYYCALVESYHDDLGESKHKVLINFGKVPSKSVPYLKATFAKKKPRLVYDDEPSS